MCYKKLAGHIFTLLSYCLLILEPELAHANNTPMGKVLCTTVGWMSGNLGMAIEIIALMVLGMLAMLGKISWQMAIIDGVAIAALFSGAQIVDSLKGGPVIACTTS